MGVSFKVAKAGSRYRPKLLQTEEKEAENAPPTEYQQRENQGDLIGLGDKFAECSTALARPRSQLISEDPEVSFSLNLFPDGFSIGKSNESLGVVPGQIHPYDKASEALFHTIEYGHLPGDVFDDIPCKYVNGAILCEIRDYRSILSQKGNTASAKKFPVIYKVVLQMCMEDVVKDVSSMSDDSWTYNDLLEVESRILKALRPDLCLNPTPMLDRFCEEPLAKKLNLGIASNKRKEKPTDALATDLVFSDSFPKTHMSEVFVSLNSQSQSDLIFQDRGVPCFEHIVKSPMPTSQWNNMLQDTVLQSFPSQSQSNLLFPVNNHLSVSTAPPNFVSSTGTIFKKCFGDPTEPSRLTCRETERYRMVANQGDVINKPKQEPLDFSQQQVPGSQADTVLEIELQMKKKLLNQKVEAEKQIQDGVHKNLHPSLVINNVQQALLEGIPKFQHRMHTCKVKERTETSIFSSLEVEMTKPNCDTICMKNNQCNLRQPQLLRSAPVSRADGLPTINDIVTQKGQASKTSQVSSYVRHASAGPCLSHSFPRERSVSAKKKSNSRPKGLTKKGAESRACTNNMNSVRTICPSMGGPMCWPSGLGVHALETSVHGSAVTGDPVLDRLSKMKMVTQRYGLNHRKRKFSQVFERKQNFHTTPLAALCLNSEDGKNLKDAITDGTSHSTCFLHSGPNTSRIRTLTFARSSHVSEGEECVISEDQNKLIILEKLDEGIVEASVVYRCERSDHIELPLLQTSPRTCDVDLFAAQFTALMGREGYHLAGDQIEAALSGVDESSTSQQLPVGTAAETCELPPPVLIPGQFPCVPSPMSSSMSGLKPSQLLSQNNSSGFHLLHPGNSQSAIQLSSNYLSRPQIDVAAHLNPMHSQWQHVMNKRAFLQFQMLQRLGLQQQLLQKRMMIGGSCAARVCMDTMQVAGGSQGFGNIDLCSFGNTTEAGHPAAIFSGTRMAGKEGKALLGGVPIQINPEVVPVCPRNIPAMAYKDAHQQMSPKEIQQQSYMLPQQQQLEMRSAPQFPEATHWTESVTLPFSQVCQQQLDQWFQMSSQPLSSASVPQKVAAGDLVADHEILELSRNPGFVASCNRT